MEILLDAKDLPYKDLFSGTAAQKLKDLQASPTFKSAQPQVSKLLHFLTGISNKPAEPNTIIPDLEIFTEQKQDLLSSPPPVNNEEAKQQPKPNAFTFMSAPHKNPESPAEKQPNLFANLTLKPAVESSLKEKASSFSFMKKEQEVKKQPGLQGIDLDFSSDKVPISAELASLNIGSEKIAQPPVNRGIQMVTPMQYFPVKQSAAMLIPSFYTKGTDDLLEGKNDDKYFGFVNEHFDDTKQ